MKIQEEIEKHEAALKRLKAAQASCQHKWGEPLQKVLEEKVPVYGNKPMGSDYYNPTIEGFETKEKMVWERVCTSCGLTQTTTKTEPVIARHQPVF